MQKINNESLFIFCITENPVENAKMGKSHEINM